ncbi:MAG: Cro/CI family transcriptional regulator [Pseudomonadota bacterium]|nr:Cro/CI family transcriptional regulator [Pseudomonadota bacterium]
MTKAEAIQLFGGVVALARAVEVTSQAVSQWPDGEIDEPRRSQITLLAIRRGLIPPVEAVETPSTEAA